MESRSNKKWIIVAAAILVVSIPAGLWVTRSSILKSGSTGAQSPSSSSGSSSDSGSGATSQTATSSAKGMSKGGSSTPQQPTSDSAKNSGSTPSAAMTASGNTATSVISPAEGTPGVTVPGGAASQGTGAPSVAQAAKEVQKEPEGCITLAYRHKKTSGHTSDDACSHHKNLIQLKHIVANPSSVCVRVNKRPVAFQTVKGHADQILIGAVAGPNTDISVRYCLGKTKCSEDCTVPKDEFLAAIGGNETGGGTQVAQWDPTEANEKEADVNGHLDKDIRNELERLDEARPDSRMAAVFQEWIAGAETPACGTASGNRQAMK